jgi:hypothetical protein
MSNLDEWENPLGRPHLKAFLRHSGPFYQILMSILYELAMTLFIDLFHTCKK